jgi:hypothetical protein
MVELSRAIYSAPESRLHLIGSLIDADSFLSGTHNRDNKDQKQAK